MAVYAVPVDGGGGCAVMCAELDLWRLTGEALGALYGRNTPVEFNSSGGWILATGQPSPDLNCALIRGPEQALESLASCLQRFQKTKTAFLICASDGAEPVVGPAAEKQKMVGVGELPLMRLERRSAEPDPNPHPHVVLRASVPSEVVGVQTFLCEQFGLARNTLRRITPPSSLELGVIEYFFVRDAHGIAGAATLVRRGSANSIWGMVTRPDVRRRGVARSILSETLRVAGNQPTFLLSTVDGTPLYRKFGFEAVAVGSVFAGRFG